MLRGIDVYAGSGVIDWPRVKAAGISFCFVRAAYGDVADKNAQHNLDGARKAGLICGVYHFLRTSRDAFAQIHLMEELVTTLRIGPGDLPPVVDMEDNPKYDGNWNPANNEQYLGMVENWTTSMQARLGAPPIVYTRAGFWDLLGNPKSFSANPLWVASYRPDHPELPKVWDDFTFWQYSESGVVDGLSGYPADLSYFRSADPEGLRSLTLK